MIFFIDLCFFIDNLEWYLHSQPLYMWCIQTTCPVNVEISQSLLCSKNDEGSLCRQLDHKKPVIQFLVIKFLVIKFLVIKLSTKRTFIIL